MGGLRCLRAGWPGAKLGVWVNLEVDAAMRSVLPLPTSRGDSVGSRAWLNDGGGHEGHRPSTATRQSGRSLIESALDFTYLLPQPLPRGDH
jgi:hypothetical protein